MTRWVAKTRETYSMLSECQRWVSLRVWSEEGSVNLNGEKRQCKDEIQRVIGKHT